MTRLFFRPAAIVAMTTLVVLAGCSPRNYYMRKYQPNYPQQSAPDTGASASGVSPALPNAVGESVSVPPVDTYNAKDAPADPYAPYNNGSGNAVLPAASSSSGYGYYESDEASEEITGSIRPQAAPPSDMIPEYQKKAAPVAGSAYDAYGNYGAERTLPPVPQKNNAGYSEPASSYGDTTQIYRVQPGDTVYSIGRKFSVKPTEIMRMNEMENPDILRPGQKLRISAAAERKASGDSKSPTMTFASFSKIKEGAAEKDASIIQAPQSKQDLLEEVRKGRAERSDTLSFDKKAALVKKLHAKKDETARFILPADGAVTQKYTVGGSGTAGGIKIKVKDGQSVKASQDGEVIYVGNIKGYGNMVLVRHEDGWVSNYARLKDVKVKQGDKVGQGAVIADGGRTADYPASEVLFELRKGTKTVDPLQYTERG